MVDLRFELGIPGSAVRYTADCDMELYLLNLNISISKYFSYFSNKLGFDTLFKSSLKMDSMDTERSLVLFG